MSNPLFQPETGVPGYCRLGGNLLSNATWAWHESCNIMDAPSFTGGGYMETAAGKVRLGVTLTGTYNARFNPFAFALGAGAYVPVIVGTRVGSQSTANVYISDWIIVDDCNDLVTFVCELVSDWLFTDFSGNPA